MTEREMPPADDAPHAPPPASQPVSSGHMIPVYYTEVRGELCFFATENAMIDDLREWVENYYPEEFAEVLGATDEEFMAWMAEVGWQFDRLSYGWGEMEMPR